MADLLNHRIFTLRCLREDIIPVNIRLKSSIETPEGDHIIRKVERALLNERVRSVNNTITMLKIQSVTCIEQLNEVLDRESIEECTQLIKEKRESRHLKTLERQKSKFDRLCQKSRKREGGCLNMQDGNHDHTCIDSTSEGERGTTQTDLATTTGENTNNNNNKNNIWVRNISSTPLTKAQEKILLRGQNFAIVPKSPPVGEYIASNENACSQLRQGEAEDLRGEIQTILKKIQPPKSNITREERRALKELGKDKIKIILTADKGVSLVVMDKEEYISNAHTLLDQPEYKSIPADPTARYKNKLISILKSIQAEGGINEVTYRRLYPTGASSPKFYGLPKVDKQGMPLRPIVSSIGAVTYQTAKELSKILKPLVGKSPHHEHNNEDFLQHLKGIQLGPDEVIISYDVKVLFTSVSIQPALTIIEKLLEEDPGLHERTSMTVKNIICLLEFCLRSTYFTFQNQYYEQVEGAAMCSPISPIVANLYMENFETRAISTSPHPPLMWKRFVDDTCVIIKEAHKQEFLEHINSIDPHIQFISEDSKDDGSMPFLDMLITPTEDGRLNTTVYRKPTHTDMYLKWDSHHPILQSIVW